MYLALALFILTYALMLAMPRYRAYVVLGSALLYVVLGFVPPGAALAAIDWNVILMIAGTMGIVHFFIKSKMPALMADIIIDRMPDVKGAVIALSLLAGIISAFVDNVATVLMVIPVAVTVAKKLKISPVPGAIAISVSANLQGAATLVGDTASILLGSRLDLNFLDFFFYKGRPGLFWVVQISVLAAALVLLWLFRKDRQPIQAAERVRVTDYFPTGLLAGMVILLIMASFLPGRHHMANGIICTGLFLIALVREVVVTRSLQAAAEPVKGIDSYTLMLLAGLFVIVAGINGAGVVDAIAGFFLNLGGKSLFAIYTLIVWVSVLLSAFVDNIPYVAAMLPVVNSISAAMVASAGINDPSVLLFFGLLSGATLGGNLTPIGASANIAALGILRREGHEVKAGTFMKMSIPFTLAAVMTGYVLLWLIWSVWA